MDSKARQKKVLSRSDLPLHPGNSPPPTSSYGQVSRGLAMRSRQADLPTACPPPQTYDKLYTTFSWSFVRDVLTKKCPRCPETAAVLVWVWVAVYV